MSELILKAQTPLIGQRLDYAGNTIEEIEGRALVSIAVPLDGAAALNDAMQAAYGTSLPAVGQFARTKVDDAIVFGMSPDQLFVMFDDTGGDPAVAVRANVGHAAYVVDQSDGWVMVRMSGDNCRAALERICPIDLDPAMFGIGNVARTVMEHLAVIIICEDADAYILLSPRSSSNSFLHALEQSAKNVA